MTNEQRGAAMQWVGDYQRCYTADHKNQRIFQTILAALEPKTVDMDFIHKWGGSLRIRLGNWLVYPKDAESVVKSLVKELGYEVVKTEVNMTKNEALGKWGRMTEKFNVSVSRFIDTIYDAGYEIVDRKLDDDTIAREEKKIMDEADYAELEKDIADSMNFDNELSEGE